MTSSTSHSAPLPKRREQVVAAALVGAVVILLGFASGLGVAPIRSYAGPSVSAPSTTGTATSSPATAATRPPANYVGVGAPGSVAVPPPAPVVLVTTASTPTHRVPGTKVRSTTGPTSAAPVTCPTGLVSSLLNSITGLSPSTGGLLSIGGLLPMLTGGLGLGLPALSLPALLAQVTHLLSGVPLLPGIGSSTGANSSALAPACTIVLSSILPSVGGGR